MKPSIPVPESRNAVKVKRCLLRNDWWCKVAWVFVSEKEATKKRYLLFAWRFFSHLLVIKIILQSNVSERLRVCRLWFAGFLKSCLRLLCGCKGCTSINRDKPNIEVKTTKQGWHFSWLESWQQCTHISLPTLTEVESEVVKNVLGKLVLKLGIQPQHLDQTRNVKTFEVAVGQGPDIAAGLDNDLGNALTSALLGGGQVLGDVAADQVTFA